MSVTALETYLAPLKDIFSREGVSEVSFNAPKEAWVEVYGDMEMVEVPAFDLEHMKATARLIAQYTEQKISEETPLLSATLPMGYRVQIVFPPACEPGRVAFSIRKQLALDFTLEDYDRLGAFAPATAKDTVDSTDKELGALLDAGDVKGFLMEAVRCKKNIIVSGGTSTGKTTFVNAMLKAIPPHERLITCEDAREININHIPNRLHLLASRGGQGRAKVTMQDLIEACLRLRPDRIVVGELRGAEAFSFLRAVNTGHPGSLSTLHADSPALAFEQLVLMVMQAGLGIPSDQIRSYIHNVVQIVVQLKRGEKGRRFVSDIYFARNAAA